MPCVEAGGTEPLEKTHHFGKFRPFNFQGVIYMWCNLGTLKKEESSFGFVFPFSMLGMNIFVTNGFIFGVKIPITMPVKKKSQA